MARVTHPDIHSYVLRVEAEHRAAAQASDASCQDELERRRRELERACARLLARYGC